MSNLINSAAELKANFAGLSLNFSWPNIKSYQEDVERDIIAETIGADALDYFTGNLTGLAGVQLQALTLLQRSSAYLTILRWSQFALFQFEDKALFLAKTTSGAIPSDKKLTDLRSTCEESGFNFLDKAIDLMERNLDLFPSYRDSGIRQSFNQGFMCTAIEFDKERSICRSRLTFLSLFTAMLDIQEDSLPAVMTDAYYQLFKERYLDGDLSADEKKLMPFIRKAVAMLTVAEGCKQLPVKVRANGLFINRYANSVDYGMQDPAGMAQADYLREDHEEKGARWLGKLRAYMIANAGTLPGYTAPVDEDINVNDKCSGLYFF